jgi:hypothetical protein
MEGNDKLEDMYFYGVAWALAVFGLPCLTYAIYAYLRYLRLPRDFNRIQAQLGEKPLNPAPSLSDITEHVRRSKCPPEFEPIRAQVRTLGRLMSILEVSAHFLPHSVEGMITVASFGAVIWIKVAHLFAQSP